MVPYVLKKCMNYFYSTKQINKLNPYWLTGFVDAEGCFFLNINKSSSTKIGYSFTLGFKISLHENDRGILESIKTFFGVGKISKHGIKSLQYQVRSIEELKIIINHFNEYPLITQKRADFELLKLAIEIINNDEHKSIEGLNKLLSIKASLNLGLSEQLKKLFPNVVPVDRHKYINQKILNPNWLAGFINGEGCFSCSVLHNPKSKLGETVALSFTITQHLRDEELIKNFIDYLDCGSVYFHDSIIKFAVRDISNINNKIIPFFDKYSLLGQKLEAFEIWKTIVEMVNNKDHLTPNGLIEIKKHQTMLNIGRKKS